MPSSYRDAAKQASRWRLRTSFDQPACDPPSIEDELADWRRRIRTAVRRLVIEDGTGKVGESLLAVHETGGLRYEEYALSREAAGVFRVVLTSPIDVAAGTAAVVVCPGRNAVLEQVTGQETPDYPDRNVAEQFSRAGFVTATVGYGLDGILDETVLAGRDEASVLAQMCAVAGQPLVGVLAQDALAVAEWLGSRPFVDPGRIGLFGHSLGAAVVLYAGLLDGHPRPLCLASYLGSFRVLAQSSAPAMLPGIGRYADLPDLMGALAPAPLHVQYGFDDSTLDPQDAAQAGQAVREIYRVAGAAGRAEIAPVHMGHGTDMRQAIRFLRTALSAVSRPEPVSVPVPSARPYFDLRMRREIGDTIDQILCSGMLTLGTEVRRFEQELAGWTGAETVTVSSGSAALEMIMRHIGVVGRTVLVPVNTFFATAASALRAGARVDFVDLEPVGLGLSPSSLLERFELHGEQVAAVVVMHTGGVVSPSLNQIISICHDRGVPVVEDAAHALGSTLDGIPAGSIADFGAYSFYPTKVLTSGEGGAVVTADERHLDEFRRARDHGRTKLSATRHDLLGTNWRLSEFHAAVGLAQLRRFAEHTARRTQAAARYDDLLRDLPAVRPYTLPPGVTTSWYKYIVFLEGQEPGRQGLKERLREQRVALAGEVYDTLLCDQPYFHGGPTGTEFPQALAFAARHICLPIYPDISISEQERVAQMLRSALA